MRACLSLFKLKLAEGFQYRIAGIMGAFTSIFWVLIEIVVYTVFYGYGNTSDNTAALTLRQTITYAWLTQVFYGMMATGIDGEIVNKINNGDVGIELCRPLDLYTHWFAKLAATRLTPLFWRGSFTLLVSLLMPVGFRPLPPDSVSGLLFMIISIVGAFLLCAAYSMLVCAARLSVQWGDGPTFMLMLVGGVLCGAFLPLQLWPDFMQKFLIWQPFAGALDIPFRLYIGTISPRDAWQYILLQLSWTAMFIVAGKWTMSTRLRKIVVQGG